MVEIKLSEIMEEIEKRHPLSLENDNDGRYVWPKRWGELKKLGEEGVESARMPCSTALISKLDEYIKFLNKANEGPIKYAHDHGWRCSQEDKDRGGKLREEIESLRKAI